MDNNLTLTYNYKPIGENMKPKTQNLSLKFLFKDETCYIFRCTKTNSVVLYNPHMHGHYYSNLQATTSSSDKIVDIQNANFDNKIQSVLPFIKQRTLKRFIRSYDKGNHHTKFELMIDQLDGVQYNFEQKSTFGELAKIFCLTEEEKYEICKNHMNEIVKEAYKEMIDLLY